MKIFISRDPFYKVCKLYILLCSVFHLIKIIFTSSHDIIQSFSASSSSPTLLITSKMMIIIVLMFCWLCYYICTWEALVWLLHPNISTLLTFLHHHSYLRQEFFTLGCAIICSQAPPPHLAFFTSLQTPQCQKKYNNSMQW